VQCKVCQPKCDVPLHRRVNWSLREILRGSDGVFTLYYNTPDGAAELRARSVALTAPAYVVADLVRAAAPNASDALKSFDYPPVGAVTLAYPLSAIRDDRKAADGSVPGAQKWQLRACSYMARLVSPGNSHRQTPAEAVVLMQSPGGCL